MSEKHIKMGIVNDNKIADSEPPITEVGFIGWLRSNLFNSLSNSILTLVALFVIYLTLPAILNWSIFNAVWSGGADACRANTNGACWPFVGAKWQQFLYGQYTMAERWRIDLGLWWLAIGITFLVFSLNARQAGKLKTLLLVVSLLWGALFTQLMLLHDTPMTALVIGWLMFGLIAYAYWCKPTWPIKNILGVSMLTLYPIISFYLLHGGAWVSFVFVFIDIALFLAIFYGLMKKVWPVINQKVTEPLNLVVNIVISIIAFWLVFKVSGAVEGTLTQLTNESGLVVIGTNYWGGFTLTLVIALTGIVASLPLGVVLALARRSEMPVIRLLATMFIEVWRAVPLITVLFMASVMFPLFVPPEASIDQLLRALIGVSLFSAAYMAEVIRGGLQAIPKGQYEGAMALGLPYWKMMTFIIMPQALKIVIPGIVNTFIGLFKDTTLVIIIGLMDFLNTVQSGMSDPNWLIYTVPFTSYFFVAFVFFVFCYCMAKYSKYLEDKLHTGHKR